jgi:hypothetical protein
MWTIVLLIAVIFVLYLYFAYKNSPEEQIKKCEKTSAYCHQDALKELNRLKEPIGRSPPNDRIIKIIDN